MSRIVHGRARNWVQRLPPLSGRPEHHGESSARKNHRIVLRVPITIAVDVQSKTHRRNIRDCISKPVRKVSLERHGLWHALGERTGRGDE